MKDKTILYLSGGMMSGVFGAGIVTGLEEANAYPHIGAIYGGSAGAFNGAYFLAHQSRLGSTIYYEDLPNRFFSWNEILKGSDSAIDREFLMGIVQREKALDVKRIQTQKIPFNIKVLNKATGKMEYLDGKVGTIEKLKQAVGVFPFCDVNNESNVDGDILDPVGLDYLLERHPQEKIVLAVNYKPGFSFMRNIGDHYCGIISATRGNEYSSFKRYFFERERRLRRDLQKAREQERILVVCPPSTSKTASLTQDKAKLIETHKMGISTSRSIVRFMRTGRK